VPARDRSGGHDWLGPAAAGLLHAAHHPRRAFWNLATSHGQLDLCFAPAGFPAGFADLAPGATRRAAAGTSVVVSVAALEDVHASKRQADRPKDREYLQSAEATP
jgi:hypothetical protein